MKQKNNNLNRVQITGMNSINLINYYVEKGLMLKNINRVTFKNIEFDINDQDYEKLKNYDTKGCLIELIKVGGKQKVKMEFFSRIGVVLGLIVSIVGIMLLNNRLLQIHISGLSNVSREQIIDNLNSKGIRTLSYMNYDLDKLEIELANEFNFSLVSIITKGNSLIINVKEELPSIENSYAPITADFNMVITSISVYAGTSCVKVGDIVYKGDTIVEPYIKSGNDMVYITPCADIVANVYFSESYVFKTSEERLVRTGKKDIVNLNISVGRWNFINQNKTCDFALYETEEVERNISNYFVPISFKKSYAYELENRLIERNFEEEKNDIISNLKSKVYMEVPSDIIIDSEEIDITEIANGYIVNLHLISTINLRYS